MWPEGIAKVKETGVYKGAYVRPPTGAGSRPRAPKKTLPASLMCDGCHIKRRNVHGLRSVTASK